MTTQFNLVGDSKGVTLSLTFSDGEIFSLTESHVNFEEARDYVLSTNQDDIDETYLRDLVDLVSKIGYELNSLSERVRLSGSTITFDNDPIDNSLTRQIVRLVREGKDEGWKGLVNFLEKVETNPSEASRKSLYSWLADRDFTIHASGDFVAYKGVTRAEGKNLSIHAGQAIVNGVTIKGHIPNPIGATVEMPRSEVNADVRNGCSTGLHAGTFEYANWFKGHDGVLLRVLINPRDVVSVPSDSSHQKLRVSRYTVLDTTENEYKSATYTSTVKKSETVDDVLESYEISDEDAPYIDRIVEHAAEDVDALEAALDEYFDKAQTVNYLSQAETAAHEVIDAYWEAADLDDEYYDDEDEDEDEDEYSSSNGEGFEFYRGRHAL